MSGTHTAVPSVLVHELPRPVPVDELAACPVGDVLRRVGDKWSTLILVLLGSRPHRYNELHRSVEAISQRMLTRTLRGLETDGLVQRTVHPTVPPGVECSLDPAGREPSRAAVGARRLGGPARGGDAGGARQDARRLVNVRCHRPLRRFVSSPPTSLPRTGVAPAAVRAGGTAQERGGGR